MGTGKRIVCFLVVVSAVFNGWWWLALPLVIWYAIRVNAYELIAAALCIDIYFSTATTVNFFYTVGALSVVFGAIVLRPLIRYR